MEIRNCTPHVLNIIKQDGEVLDLLPCGIVPRCSQSEECVLVINDIALTRQTFGEVVDFPAILFTSDYRKSSTSNYLSFAISHQWPRYKQIRTVRASRCH